MKRLLLIPAMLLALTVAGCGTGGSKLGDLLSIATTTITNPVDAVDIYRVKNVYAAALQGMKEYRKFCWSKPYRELMVDPVARPVCQRRRPVVRAMQLAQARASSAVVDAAGFVRDNPTLNASDVIAAAWRAVTNFQNAVPAAN